MKKLIPIFLVLSVFVGCNSAVPEKTLSTAGDSALDQKFYDQGVMGNDVTLCAQILNEGMKAECTSIANAGTITAQAVISGDLALCKKIDLPRYRTACETQTQPVVDAKQADADREKIAQAAQEKQDPKLCDQIKDANQKATCKYNIIANKALEEKNPSLCIQIGNKVMEDECKSFATK
ncbi:hypothetical protein M0P48_00560 [Candidatus Gracilibacteria bacterium]|jgi:2-succinyl-5-enolpyruvyl-6-hydroxy-3-cyclohexene-1-carboxylate synthase|nr:hypothetical protein [Candidatus Gracilibacteria bacterium]